MTTLVLGIAGAAVGFAVGGPFGAAIGWSLGAAVGGFVDPQQIQGPRIGDKKLMVSSYGSAIPIVYGSFRTAGAGVIWQTDLVEHEQTSGGKGSPEVTTYSYSASYACLICEGPIVEIRRIWADGRIIRDPESSSADLPITIYLGTELQEPDPTMEADKGAGEVPAHRGYAYVVFTDHDLTPFGNRIPNLEFEVVTGVRANCPLVSLNRDALAGEWYATGDFPGGNNGQPYPYITAWNASDIYTEPTLVDADTMADVYDHSAGVGLQRYTVILTPTALHNMGGQSEMIWFSMTDAINPSPIDPKNVSLGAGNVWVEDYYDGYLYTYQSFSDIDLSACGITTGLYVHAVVGSHNNQRAFVFTGEFPHNGTERVTLWWELVNGVVQRNGTVIPALTQYDLGNGTYQCPSYAQKAMTAEFENNGKFMWQMFNGFVRCYEIDEANNFAMICSPLEVQQDASFPASAIAAGNGRCVVAQYLTFEVFSRNGSGSEDGITLGEIVEDISVRDGFGNAKGLDAGEIDVSELVDLVPGYCVTSQMSKRAAIEPLMMAYFFDGVESDAIVKFPKRAQGSSIEIPEDDLAAHDYGSELPALVTIRRGQEDDLPRSVALSYINQAADYQPGLQLAQRQTGNASRDESPQVAIVLADEYAKRTADALMYDAWIQRDKYKFSTSRKYLALDPCDVVTINERNLRIIRRTEAAGGVLTFEAVASEAGVWVQSGVPGESDGFPPQEPPAVHVTEVQLLAVPAISDNDPALGFAVAMADNAGTSWPGAVIYVSKDEGVTWAEVDSAITADTFGTASTTLGAFGGGNIFDELNTLTVVLTAGAGTLASATELAVLNGANTAMIGNEVIQYRTATLTATRTYKLSRLLRGRHGTEFAIGTHAAGETFAVLPTHTLIASESADIGRAYWYKAVTFGTTLASATTHVFTNTGVAARPYAPVQLGGGRAADGAVALTWQRRARVNGAWLDYVDVPQEQAYEPHLITIYADGTYASVKFTQTQSFAEADTRTYTYTAAQQTADFGSTQSVVYWGVQVRGATGYGTEARGST